MEGILIPVKRLEEAKGRLARLGPAGRRRLALAMLADVLHATADWPFRLMVTSDPQARALGRAGGLALIPDPGLGLNRAIDAGTLEATRAGIRALLVLPSDVPLVSAAEVSRLFSLDAQLVIARSDDGGTSALLRRPPAVIGARFGPSSAAAHALAGQLAGLRVLAPRMASLALDVDDITDVGRLAASRADRKSVAIARELLCERRRV
ncbi:MAG: 2-phospho-L-lactate guanylyltransferase [Actinomycetota bacterium]